MVTQMLPHADADADAGAGADADADADDVAVTGVGSCLQRNGVSKATLA